MGKYDDAMYRYLSDNHRFADLFNAVLFSGREVVRGEALEDASERCVDVITQVSSGEHPQYDKSVRDIRKRINSGERHPECRGGLRETGQNVCSRRIDSVRSIPSAFIME